MVLSHHNIQKLFIFLFLCLLLLLSNPFKVSAISQIKNDPISSGLVSYYTLDESSGIRNDATSTNDLTDNNTVLSAPAIINDGADYEYSNNEYLNITDASQTGLDFSDKLTFSGWLKLESYANGYPPIVFKRIGSTNQRSYSLYLDSTHIYFESFTNGSTVGCAVNVSWTSSLSTFYYLSVTKNGTSVKFYINGSQQGTTQTCTSATIYNGTAPFELGSFASDSSYFDGILDEWLFSSRDLSSTEISTLYNSGTGVPYEVTSTPSQCLYFEISNMTINSTSTCSTTGATSTCTHTYSTSTPVQVTSQDLLFMLSVILYILAFLWIGFIISAFKKAI